jgi:hypothetical protein
MLISFTSLLVYASEEKIEFPRILWLLLPNRSLQGMRQKAARRSQLRL